MRVNLDVYDCVELKNTLNSLGVRDYFVSIPFTTLDNLFQEWLEVNLRKPDLKEKKTNKAIVGMNKVIKEEPIWFYIKNKGLTIMTNSFSFDRQNKKISFDLTDKQMDGLADGGHTYLNTLKNSRSGVDVKDIMLRLEFISGVYDKNRIVDIVSARNTGVQVKEYSKQNGLGYYDKIKEIIADRDFADNIIYMENDYDADFDGSNKCKNTEEEVIMKLLGPKKKINVSELLRLQICFAIGLYPDNLHNPTSMYNKVSAVYDLYEVEKNRKCFDKVIPLMNKIIDLYNLIWIETPSIYAGRNEKYNTKYIQNGRGGRTFGNIPITKCLSKPKKLPFCNEETKYFIPYSITIPLLASFRVLVGEDTNGNYYWKYDPIKFFEEFGEDLIMEICEKAKDALSSQKLGGSPTTWRNLYDMAESRYKEIQYRTLLDMKFNEKIG